MGEDSISAQKQIKKNVLKEKTLIVFLAVITLLLSFILNWGEIFTSSIIMGLIVAVAFALWSAMLAFIFIKSEAKVKREMEEPSEKKQMRKKLSYLMLSGAFMGCAIATKWIGVFAGVGLALIFFIDLTIKIVKKKETKSNIKMILISCIVYFIVIPICIYILSYTPFFLSDKSEINNIWDGSGKNENEIVNLKEEIEKEEEANKELSEYDQLGKLSIISKVVTDKLHPSLIQEQLRMYKYHHDDVKGSMHDYASPWYTWPFMIKNVWYWSRNV
jgi:dolichyl-phosphate-mannose--protein O-mannosyl transferase